MAPIDDLARVLSDTTRIGLDADLAKALRIADEDVTRARLRAQINDGRGPVSIHLLGAWVKDCRDAIGKGEVYWWSIPMVARTNGAVQWDPLCGLPSGAPPFSVGNESWLESISLKDPPLLGVVSQEDDIAAAVIHLAFYEDDWAPAVLAPALKAGMTALAENTAPAANADALVKPVREPIWTSLKAKQDDFMIEEDVKFLRKEGLGFGAGLVTALLNQYIRVYVFAKDVERTESAGPYSLAKGQEQRVLFPSSLEGGGRVVVFSRGKVRVDPFGELNVDAPYIAHVIEDRQEAALAEGVTISAEEEAGVVAYYTPPRAS